MAVQSSQIAAPGSESATLRPVRGKRAWAQAAVVFAAALLVRLVNLDRDAHIDEFFHILAAQSWLADGTLQIADGAYNRSALYTIGLSGWFSLFGDSFISARMPSALAGSLWVAAVFLWTRAAAGPAAAWIAACLFGLAPGAIWLSQFTRFYTIHGLLFWLGAAGVYALLTRASPALNLARAALALGAATCFALATHLQITTLIGLVGVGLWAAYELVRLWLRSSFPWRIRLIGLAAAGIIAIALASGLVTTDSAAALWSSYRGAAFWNTEAQNYPGYYFNLFLAQYPTLWPLLPAAALVAIAARPRPALFASIVFATAFLLHSFAGNKLERYIYYAIPYLFVIWGIALAQILPVVGRALARATDQALNAFGLGERARLRRLARGALLAVAVGFLVIANPAFKQTLVDLLQPSEPKRADAWRSVRQQLQPLIDSVDVLVTTDELRSLYYLGRSDILLNRNRLMETPDPAEFKDDPRTGRPIISTSASFRLVMDCSSSGLFITEERFWRSPEHGGDVAADLLTERAESIEVSGAQLGLPEGYAIKVFHWDRDDTAAASSKCAPLRAIDRQARDHHLDREPQSRPGAQS